MARGTFRSVDSVRVTESLQHFAHKLKKCSNQFDTSSLGKKMGFQQICVEKKQVNPRVSIRGVKSLGGHFACLCRGFDFYEVKKKKMYFSKRKWKYFDTFNHNYSEKSSKRANSTNHPV